MGCASCSASHAATSGIPHRGDALVVSQFTLVADSRRQKGTRPDFSHAAAPEVAEPLYEHFCDELRAQGIAVETGLFGARMDVELVNAGPVTIVLDAWGPVREMNHGA